MTQDSFSSLYEIKNLAPYFLRYVTIVTRDVIPLSERQARKQLVLFSARSGIAFLAPLYYEATAAFLVLLQAYIIYIEWKINDALSQQMISRLISACLLAFFYSPHSRDNNNRLVLVVAY